MVPVWSNPLFLWVEVDVDDDQDDAPEDVDDDDHVGDRVKNWKKMSNWSPKII